jgi:hypothetical protein
MSSVLRKIAKNSRLHGSPKPLREQQTGAGHRFIQIGRYHRNQQNAEKYALDLFRKLDPSVRSPKSDDLIIRSGEGADMFEASFREAVTQARERGSAEALRVYTNGPEPYFGPAISISADGEGPTIELALASHKMKLKTPMRQGSVEIELTEDILEHRRKASEMSLKGHDGFQTTAMHFRGYLLVSCALVEAFLNRHVVVDIANGRSSANLTELQKPCSVERRFELWVQEFCGKTIATVKSSAEWSDFQELRQRRNSLMHSAHGILGIELKDTARQLNLVRRGVGGLISLLRQEQSLPPLPFAERLETAPEATFCSEVLKR